MREVNSKDIDNLAHEAWTPGTCNLNSKDFLQDIASQSKARISVRFVQDPHNLVHYPGIRYA